MARNPAFIRWPREKEARVQSRMLDVLERRFRRQLAKVLYDITSEMTEHVRVFGSVPPLPDDAERRIRDVYEQLAVASARTFGARILTQGKSIGLIEIKQEDQESGGFAEFFRRLARQWINSEAIRQRVTRVARTTRDRIVGAVDRGQRDGLGVDGIARNIMDETPGISRQRGALIARTETHGAANYAMHETAKSTGLELVKEWVATEDTRTRALFRDDQFDHFAMDGQIREMDEPFDMPWIGGGGEPLKIMYPGEAGKPGGAVINCRCSVVHNVKSPE